MNKYEVMFIIHADLEDQPRTELIERFTSLIAKQGGNVDKLDEWGKRRLAYPIEKQAEGYYVLMHMSAGPEVPRELERNFSISEYVIRYLVTRIEE